MTFDEWREKHGIGEAAAGLSLARDAWEAAQSEKRTDYYKRANWASLNGLFSPVELRAIADTIEAGYGPGLH
jgi:hypothetical protein